jgi:hypothetical protein
MIAAKPLSPDERIVKHAEFAARFDVHQALDMSGRHLSNIEFYNLDVLAVMASLVLLAFLVLFFVTRFALRFLFFKLLGKSKRE